MRFPLPGHLLFLALAANMSWAEVDAQAPGATASSPDAATLRQITIFRCGDKGQNLQDRPCARAEPASSASIEYEQPSDEARHDAQSRTKAQAELADKLEAARLRREAEQKSAAQTPVIINPAPSPPEVIVLSPPRRKHEKPEPPPRFVGSAASAASSPAPSPKFTPILPKRNGG